MLKCIFQPSSRCSIFAIANMFTPQTMTVMTVKVMPVNTRELLP